MNSPWTHIFFPYSPTTVLKAEGVPSLFAFAEGLDIVNDEDTPGDGMGVCPSCGATNDSEGMNGRGELVYNCDSCGTNYAEEADDVRAPQYSRNPRRGSLGITFGEGLDVVNEQEAEEDRISGSVMSSVRYSYDGIELRLEDEGDARDTGDVLRLLVSILVPEGGQEVRYEKDLVTSISTRISRRQGLGFLLWVYTHLLRIRNGRHFAEQFDAFCDQLENISTTEALGLHTEAGRTAQADALQDFEAEGSPDSGRTVVNHGYVVEWSAVHAPGYTLENDERLLREINQAVDKHVTLGHPRPLYLSSVYTERASGKTIRWRIVDGPDRHKKRTAATPAHQGEYTWEEFRTAVRPGQVWQTNNSLIRIDRLLHPANDRRSARYIRFRGAWTGSGPRAIKALLPNEQGEYKTSTGPWTVSRRYGPFLLIAQDVRQMPTGVEEEREEPLAISLPPDTPTADSRSQQALLAPEVQAGLRFEGLRTTAEGLDVMQTDPETVLPQVVDFVDSHWRGYNHGESGIAVNIKVYGVDVPRSIRRKLTDEQIDKYMGWQAEQYLQDIKDDYAEKPWFRGVFYAGRSGGWLMFEINAEKLFALPNLDLSEFREVRDTKVFVQNMIADLRSWTDEYDTVSDEQLEYLIGQRLAHGLQELQALVALVQKYKQYYINDGKSLDFWRDVLSDM